MPWRFNPFTGNLDETDIPAFNGEVTLGSAASPSIFFTGDPNTGIYSPGADQVAISTNGTGRLFVDAGGTLKVATSADPTFGTFPRPAFYIKQLSDPTNSFGGIHLEAFGEQSVFGIGYDSNLQAFSLEASYRVTGGFRPIVFKTSSSERLRITSTGTVNIVGAGFAGTTQAVSFNGSAPVNSVVLDASGRLLLGTSSSVGSNAKIQAITGDLYCYEAYQTGTNAYPAQFNFTKTRGTAGTFTVVAAEDYLGTLSFRGTDGSAIKTAAEIHAVVDGTPGANDMPGRLVFSTTKDGQSSPTEAMRINASQQVLIGGTTPDGSQEVMYVRAPDARTGIYIDVESTGGFTGIIVDRTSSDGDLISFFQAGTLEGSISVSGTSISYNGAHLSRWSQLPGGAERTEILRGTVLSNIDEMCEWSDEENEQLNRMKVSDVEGDKNVSGVFQAWDDDEPYTNDFYCAMTGDFIIRIAQGVTVERGDLLMSAGDGTAKPQDDDIIRSKTIAKVTSTNVSCTHPDGSYCVPCVLMAC